MCRGLPSFKRVLVIAVRGGTHTRIYSESAARSRWPVALAQTLSGEPCGPTKQHWPIIDFHQCVLQRIGMAVANAMAIAMAMVMAVAMAIAIAIAMAMSMVMAMAMAMTLAIAMAMANVSSLETLVFCHAKSGPRPH